MCIRDSSTRNSLTRLWNNQQARSVIIQIVTVTIVFALLALILRNVVNNLEAIGKEFSFKFLLSPAAYDITFSPFIEYSSRSTHLRAAVVGILNTLLVAACGIVLATVMGFLLGILRLSRNWLVNRMVYCFLEFTRNVPILLHILFIHGIIVTQLNPPRQAMNFADSFFLSNRGFFIPQPVWEPIAWIVAVVFLVSLVYLEATSIEIVCVLSFFQGMALAFDLPARQGLVYYLVERENLSSAIALNTTTFHIGAFIGPALFGLVVRFMGMEWAFLINAVTFIFFFFCYNYRRWP